MVAVAGSFASAVPAEAQAVAQAPASQLPPVNVTAPNEPRRAPRTAPAKRAERGSQKPRPQPARQAEQAPPLKEIMQTQDVRTGTVGYYSNSTSVATKTNTPLVNIPQSMSVITKDLISDQNPQNLTDVTRYVPGVAIHQGEGNRDELVIRGVDSSANFFVNGFRDDVQYFRDLYNTQSIEILEGAVRAHLRPCLGRRPSQPHAQGSRRHRVYEATAQTGSWGDRRVTLDAGQAINENVAARLNVFYEGADAFRDFNHLERYGINPTVTLRPDEDTKVRLSYEYFHDDRTADRGNPSQALPGFAGPATGSRFNPTTPVCAERGLLCLLRQPEPEQGHHHGANRHGHHRP